MLTPLEDEAHAWVRLLASGEATTADAEALQKRVDQLKKEGRKSALLLVANAEGELRFVALNLQ